ncbi:cytochrome P450 [Pseudonocardia eucalypti]|uniref:Cytochrome P450 n=1 Tax=Pseudonocardia eucalypti TaxID=648755 RepID=A0ABP9QZM5_9PSEU|nr:cholest-4-en-3-one 26-monooxygenase [Pseudonocardia eucalypti]
MVVGIPNGFDFTDPDLYAQRVPLAEFAELRRTAPVWWNAQEPGTGGWDDGGFWVVSRHADVKAISLNSEVYSTWENGAIIRFTEGITREQIEMQRFILINNDPPQHTPLRQIVSRGFTPKAINSLREALADRAERIVHEARAKGSGDFVTDVACELPLQAIAELIGIPQEDRHKIFDWSNQMIGTDDPEYQDMDPTAASMGLLGYAMNMAEERKSTPTEDIVTKLVNADIDGRGLNPDEFGFFVLLLAVAGNETTRNAITHGMIAMLEHPEQWERYKAERPATAADEIVRWATPVVAFQRTAKVDTHIGEQEIKKGQRVGIFYGSANFDEEVFDHPERFDVGRDPNPQLGFGGGGAHYCLGANLAKLEIDLMFNAIAEHLPDITMTGTPRRLRSGWLSGIKGLPVRYA